MKADERGLAHIAHEREVNTYSELWHASWCVLEKGRAEEQGCAWQFLSSIVLSAFALEAYMNHVGDGLFDNWDDLERALSPLAKLRHICLALGLDIGRQGERPLQTLHDLIRVRNQLAHGRSETLRPPPKVVPYNAGDFDALMREAPTTDWERRIRTADFADRVREDMEFAFAKIHDALPEPKLPLFSFGFHSSSSSRAG